MTKQFITKSKCLILSAMLVLSLALIGCGKQGNTKEATKIDLPDGQYLVDFNTDSSMFHVNEAKDGKGILTVENGQAEIHIVMPSQNVVTLYLGLVKDAEGDSANHIAATLETVTYTDGTTEEVNAFDVPVPVLDEEFDLALVGKKGTWYDHKVSVSNPVPYTEPAEEVEPASNEVMPEGEWINVTLQGGTGKATVESPAKLEIHDDGITYVTIIWSSPNYDYMIVGEEKYLPVNEEGNSTFIIPVADLNSRLAVIADTVAMSTPHEIEYELEFSQVNQ